MAACMVLMASALDSEDGATDKADNSNLYSSLLSEKFLGDNGTCPLLSRPLR